MTEISEMHEIISTGLLDPCTYTNTTKYLLTTNWFHTPVRHQILGKVASLTKFQTCCQKSEVQLLHWVNMAKQSY